VLLTLVVDKPAIKFLLYELKRAVSAGRKVFNIADNLEKFLPPNFV